MPVGHRSAGAHVALSALVFSNGHQETDAVGPHMTRRRIVQPRRGWCAAVEVWTLGCRWTTRWIAVPPAAIHTRATHDTGKG